MGASESRNKYLPKQFSDAAFRSASGEAAWTLKMVAGVVDWLGQNGYGVLGAEIWIVTPTGEICTLCTDVKFGLANGR